jgi:hypothetical protein
VADDEDRAREATRAVSQMASAAGNKVKGVADKAAARSQRAADGIAEDAMGAVDHASEWADQATATVANMASSAGAAARRLQVQGDRLSANISRRAREQPFSALFIAGAVGYVLAYLLHGRR